MRSRSLTAFCLTTLLALGGCGSGGDEPTGPGQTGSGTLSAKIDGVDWTPTVVSANTGSGVLIVAAADGTGRGLGFAAAITQGVGPQSTGPTSLVNANSAQGGQGWLATANIGSGSVTLTTLETNRAAGTFTFTLQGTSAATNPATRRITEGRFDVRF